MKRNIIVWIALSAFVLVQTSMAGPWSPKAKWTPKADALYNGSTYTDGSSILDTDGTIDTTATNSTNVKTFIKNAMLAATTDITILGQWTYNDSISVLNDWTTALAGVTDVNNITTFDSTVTFSDSTKVTGGTRLTGVNITGALAVGGAITTTSTQAFGTYGTTIKAIFAGQAAFTTTDLIDTIAFNTASDLTATDVACVTMVTDTAAVHVAVAVSANGDTLFVTRAGGGASAAKYNYIVIDK